MPAERNEILEAASVASLHPPANLLEFNEGNFERAAHTAQDTWPGYFTNFANAGLATGS